MVIPFFDTVDDYNKMLDKIAISTFMIIYFCVYQIVYNTPDLYEILQNYLIEIDLFGFKFPMAILLPSIILAFFSRAIKLHDRISDLFKIREKYDLFEILYPFAILTTDKMSLESFKKIKTNRKELMNNCFYKFASSKDSKPPIDKHLITMAIDQFSWYWIIIEALFYIFLSLLFFIITKNQVFIILFLVITIFLVFISLPLLKMCKVYTRKELEAIIKLPKAKAEIIGAFNAL